ncbi:signal transduction histidine kinase [Runella slithyformis DSM 19594]|uniref:histidine kinase n=2 Tax=Runella TaxID=105 RepID=A0A7U3ZK29_RUNSL|nr:signal transduction histidine kinase [Runella slithyformis DSM 19594]
MYAKLEVIKWLLPLSLRSISMFMRCLILLFLWIYATLAFGQTKPSFESEKRKAATDIFAEGIEEQDSLKMAEGYYLLGKYESGIGNFLSTKYWINKSIAIYKRLPISVQLGKTYQWLAFVECSRKNMKEAVAYSDSALVIFKKLNSPKGIVSNYMFVTDMSHQYFRKSPAVVLKDFDAMVLYIIQNNIEDELGFMYQMKGDLWIETDHQAAVESFLKASYWFNKYGNGNINALNYRLAYCYAKLGKPKKARQVLGDGSFYNQDPEQDQFLFPKLSRLKAETAIFEAEKNWLKAYEMQKKYTELQDEIHTKEQNKLVSSQNELDVTALALSQEKELMLQSEVLRANQKKQYLFYSVGGILLVFAGTFYYQYAKSKKLARQYRQISEKNKLLIKEQSHRVKNNLQVISSLIGLQINRLQHQDLKDLLEEMQGRIAVMSLLQQLFYETNDTVEIDAKVYFAQIVDKTAIIFNKSINAAFLIENEQITPNLAIHLGIILNELLTNSFKYAFGFDNPNPSVEIAFKVSDNELTFEYKDNGKNGQLLVFEKEYYSTYNSFGLSLIRLKSSELGGTYSFMHDNGLRFILKCPSHETKSVNS